MKTEIRLLVGITGVILISMGAFVYGSIITRGTSHVPMGIAAFLWFDGVCCVAAISQGWD